jgi:hypothetical protein
MRRSSGLAIVVFVPGLCGCPAYQHETTLVVSEPRSVVLEVRNKPPIDPAPGTTITTPEGVSFTRDRDGAFRMGSRTFVESSGEIDEEISSRAYEGGDLRIRIAYGRRHAHHEWLRTPASKVKSFRERDAPMRWIGGVEMAFGAGIFAAGFPARDKYSSGATILFTSGTILAIVGAIQLFAPNENEHSLK